MKIFHTLGKTMIGGTALSLVLSAGIASAAPASANSWHDRAPINSNSHSQWSQTPAYDDSDIEMDDSSSDESISSLFSQSSAPEIGSPAFADEPSSDLSALAVSTKADKVISYAQSLKGKVKYVFGANDASKHIFDCSSFTKYVFASQGVTLKRTSREQAQQGTKVSMANLRKGDLMFFTVGSSKTIGHVGIYMGNGQFIHNTTGSKVNGVIISSFNSSYQKRFVSGARVL